MGALPTKVPDCETERDNPALHDFWPDLGPELTVDMTDRALMGLPDHFQATRSVTAVDDLGQLRQLSVQELAFAVSDEQRPLQERLCAGNLLALFGDPRLDPVNPTMCDVPGGSYTIGLHADAIDSVLSRYAGLGLEAAWIEKEIPEHKRTLGAFRIGMFPVTNLEFSTFLHDTRFPEIPTSWAFGRYPEERSNHPVYSVTAKAAEAYTFWLSGQTGRNFRLPREAEWEVAASGAESREFPWGDVFHPDHANTLECGLLNTSPVGAFPSGASPFGAMDMAGNAEEYVAEDYAPYPGGRCVNDELSHAIGTYRVLRGGGFTRFRDLARTRRRHGRYPRDIYAAGFRLAESVE